MGKGLLAAAAGAMALLLSACGSSTQVPASVTVVPLAGEVAGHGYGYWLGRVWIYDYAHSQPAPCVTMTSGGASLVVVAANAIAPGNFTYSCSARAGLPAYVPGFSTECNTLPQRHSAFENSPAGLLACARRGYDGTTASVEVNGRTYDATKFAAASSDQPFQVAAGNSISFSTRSLAGRFVAYGNGVLFQNLGKGTYKIIDRWNHLGTAWTYTYTVHVS